AEMPTGRDQSPMVRATVASVARILPISVRSRQGHPQALVRNGLTGLYALVYICSDMHLDLFQTLADPTRRHIVELLRGGERAVNDIVDAMDIDQSGVSRHLRILNESGFVDVRPDGPRRVYSLRPEPFRELEAWVTAYRTLWEARLDRFGEALQRRQRRRASQQKEHAK